MLRGFTTTLLLQPFYGSLDFVGSRPLPGWAGTRKVKLKPIWISWSKKFYFKAYTDLHTTEYLTVLYSFFVIVHTVLIIVMSKLSATPLGAFSDACISSPSVWVESGVWGDGGECPLPSRLGGLGERRKLPKRGPVWSSSRKRICGILQSHKSPMIEIG